MKFINGIKKIFLGNYAKYKYKRYKKYCKRNRQKEFYIFNTPIHGNVGDHAIAYAEYKLLGRYNIRPFEIPTFHANYYMDTIKRNISNDAIVSITGGGFMGSEWISEENMINQILSDFKNHKVIIFPHTIYYKDDVFGRSQLDISIDAIAKIKDIHILAREERTYKFAKKMFPNAEVSLVPDIVLTLDRKNYGNDRNGILLCFRSDAEKNIKNKDIECIKEILKNNNYKIDETDTVIKGKVLTKRKRKKVLNDKLKEFSQYELVITDRLHGMVFAAITSTPCIVFGNYNYKVEGVFEWIKNKNIIFKKSIDNIEEDVLNLLNSKNFNVDIDINYEDEYKELYKLLEEI